MYLIMVKPNDSRPLWLTLNSLKIYEVQWWLLVFQTGAAHFHPTLEIFVLFFPIQTVLFVMCFDFNSVKIGFSSLPKALFWRSV